MSINHSFSNHLEPNGDNRILFGNLIRSDGFTVDCLFYKRARSSNPINSCQLELADFEYQEVQNTYKPTFIDPGRKSVFTAAGGLNNEHTLMRCTTKEYYHYTGSTRYLADQQKRKKEAGMTKLESEIPSYCSYITYMLNHLGAFFAFYNATTAKDRFFLYQGRQRAPEKMVEMLVSGGPKYNRKKRKKKKKKKRVKKQQAVVVTK